MIRDGADHERTGSTTAATELGWTFPTERFHLAAPDTTTRAANGKVPSNVRTKARQDHVDTIGCTLNGSQDDADFGGLQ